MVKVVLLNHTGKESNWGCQATSANLVNLLSRAEDISIDFIDIEYRGGFYRKLLNKIRSLFSFVILNQKQVQLFSNIFKYLHPLENENINKIEDCDILILNGEGSLHGFTSELIKFIQYLSLANKLGKKVFTLNQSLYFDNYRVRKYLKELFKYSEINYFREQLSVDNAKLLNVKKLKLVADAAFLNHRIKTDKIDSNIDLPANYILASGSVVLTEQSDSFFDILNKIKGYYNLPIIFIASCEVDKALKHVIIKKHNFVYYDNNDLNFLQVQKLIKGSEFLVSGRFHLNIFSACVGKLFIPFVSNTKKMQGLVNLLDYPINPIRTNNLNIDEEFGQINKFIEKKEELELHLYERSKKLAFEVEKSYEQLLH